MSPGKTATYKMRTIHVSISSQMKKEKKAGLSFEPGNPRTGEGLRWLPGTASGD
jgi:hypothetical protein